jgi:hypothetical protein
VERNVSSRGTKGTVGGWQRHNKHKPPPHAVTTAFSPSASPDFLGHERKAIKGQSAADWSIRSSGITNA